jgi:ribonucleoside-diphosphate reductase alpha chain
LADSVGILTSVALQHGVPLETLVKKLSYCRFEPSGWTANPRIKHASSIVDYIFRWLRAEFCSSEEFDTEAPHE